MVGVGGELGCPHGLGRVLGFGKDRSQSDSVCPWQWPHGGSSRPPLHQNVHSEAECRPSHSVYTVFPGGQGRGRLWESLGCPLFPVLWSQKERVFAELGSGQLPILQGRQGPGPSEGHGMRGWNGRTPKAPGEFGGWSRGERPGLLPEEGPRGTN